MKKLVLLAIVAVSMMMMSCSKTSTYQVRNGTSGYTLYGVTVYEYQNSSVVGQNYVGSLWAGDMSSQHEAASNANRVKVAMKFEPGGEIYTTTEYTSLVSGGNTIVLLDDYTYVRNGSKGEVRIVDLKK